MKQVEFIYAQTLQTVYPGYEVRVTFSVSARVYRNEAVEILSIQDEYGGILTIPNASTVDGRKFLALIREAARDEAYRISKQAVEAAQNQTI